MRVVCRLVAAILGLMVLPDLAAQPHIVFMALDDVGWADVSYHGSDFPTPNIDRLAQHGVQLDRFYVQPVCSPTRSSFMTGRYPFRTGMQHRTTLVPGTTASLPANVPTIAELLKETGYSTYMIGKWHLGYASWKRTPTGRGFDSHLGYLQGAVDYYNKTVGRGFDFWRNQSPAWDAVGGYSMDAYMDEAQRIVKTHDRHRPMFLYFAHQHIHTPLQDPPGSASQAECAHVSLNDPDGKNRNTLCRMMNTLDKNIGDFVAMLKFHGMWENTVMWVSTDNGGMAQFRNSGGLVPSASSNFPLRAGKATLFEGGVRGVSFISGGLIPATARGTVYHGLLQHVDIPVTLAALGGAKMSNSDGFNVWEPIMTGAASPRTEVPLNVDTSFLAHHNFSGLIQGKWKLINGQAGLYDGWWSNDPYTRTLPTVNQSAVKSGGVNVWLFDLSVDQTESANLASSHPEVVASMQQRLAVLADPANGYEAPQPNFPHPLAAPWLHNQTWAPWLPVLHEHTELFV